MSTANDLATKHVYLTEPEQLIETILAFERQHRTTKAGCVAVDCETNGDDPYQSTVYTLQMAVPGLPAVVADLRTVLTDYTRVMLNLYLANQCLVKLFQGGKFELKMLAKLGIALRPPYFDTMLVSQLLQCGQQKGSKLIDLSQQYLGVSLDKSLQTSFLGLPPDAMLSQEQITYAAEDVLVLLKLYQPMQVELKRHQSNTRTWEREQNFLPLLAALEMGGIRFRSEHLVKFHERLTNQVKTYRLYTEGALVGEPAVWGGYDPVNLDDPASVKAAMAAQGIPYSSDKDNDLLKQADYPAVAHLLQYRYLKRQLEQVKGLCDVELHTHGNRQFHLLPRYSQLEYLTGRLSHSHTGLEALMPWGDEEQERVIGSLLMARSEGLSLIGIKLKEAPLRLLAQVTRDETLINLYTVGGNRAVTWLADTLGTDHKLSWALWMGAGVYGYRKVNKWQEFAYQSTGCVVPVEQAKELLKGFWEMMPRLKQWHQDNPTSKQRSFTLSGRYRYGYLSSHSDLMAHSVMGSLSDLVKEAAIEIHQVLMHRGGKPYLILNDYLIWEVPTHNQQELLELATAAMMERCHKFLPNVVKDWQAGSLTPMPSRDVLL